MNLVLVFWSRFGLLVNFGNREIEYKRLHHPLIHPAAEGDPKYHVFSNVVPQF